MNEQVEAQLRAKFTIPETARIGWHFCNADATLGYGDGRNIVVGETLEVTGRPQVCLHGLHASPSIAHARNYQPCIARLALVWVDGDMDSENDKFCGLQRCTLAMLSVEQTAALDAEYEAARAALDAEYEAALAALYAEYEAPSAALYAEYEAHALRLMGIELEAVAA